MKLMSGVSSVHSSMSVASSPSTMQAMAGFLSLSEVLDPFNSHIALLIGPLSRA